MNYSGTLPKNIKVINDAIKIPSELINKDELNPEPVRKQKRND